MHNPDASALHGQHLGPVRHHCRNRLEDNTLGGLKGATANRTPQIQLGLHHCLHLHHMGVISPCRMLWAPSLITQPSSALLAHSGAN